jgi:serine phosphatase RsbU (regulator of sigma subunit)
MAGQSSAYQLDIDCQPQDQLSGDYADAIPMSRGRLFICLADVCGKGPRAAAHANRLRAKVRELIDQNGELSEIMAGLNDDLRATLSCGLYVTMFAGVFDAHCGELHYVNAGHPPALLQHGNALPTLLRNEPELPLGIEQASPVVHKISLLSGDMLILYSDGCADPSGYGAPLSYEGLAQLIASTAAQVPHSFLATKCLARLRDLQHCTSLDDDRTLLFLRLGLRAERFHDSSDFR